MRIAGEGLWGFLFCFVFIFFKGQAIVVQASNPNIMKAGGPGQPGQHRETLSQKTGG